MALRIMSLPLGRALAYSGGEKLAMAVKAKKWEQQTVKMAPAPVRGLQTAREHTFVSGKFMSSGLSGSQQWSHLSRPFSSLWHASNNNSSSFLSISRCHSQEVSQETIMRASAAVDWRSKYAQLAAASAAEPAAVTGPAQLPQGEMVAPAAPPAAAPAPKSNVQGLMSPAQPAAPGPRAARKSNVLAKAASIDEAAAADAADKAAADMLAQQRAESRAAAAAAKSAHSGAFQSAPSSRDQAAPKLKETAGPKPAAASTVGGPTGRAADIGRPVAKPARQAEWTNTKPDTAAA